MYELFIDNKVTIYYENSYKSYTIFYGLKNSSRARNIHSGITFIPPKTSVPVHFYNTEEQVTIIKKGKLKIILDGDQEVICNSYDSTFISSNIHHKLINDTDEEVHALIIYGSIDVTRTFTETRVTVITGSDKDNSPERNSCEGMY